MEVVTVAQRRASEIARLQAADAAAMVALADLARAHGVRSTVFGSFACGNIVATSDFDAVVDGPEAAQRPARNAAETICERLGLRPDILLARKVSARLRLRIDRDGRP